MGADDRGQRTARDGARSGIVGNHLGQTAVTVRLRLGEKIAGLQDVGRIAARIRQGNSQVRAL